LLRQYGIRPVKRRGQHFLVDGNLARSIARTTLELGTVVLELGAGAGALTTHLLAGGARVTAVEVDRRLGELLRNEWGEQPGFRLLSADLARLDWPTLLADVGPQPVVAGNLPYVLTSTVLFALADQRDQLAGAVLMVQQEVAARLTAEVGGKNYGVLTALLGSVFRIDLLRRVPRSVFWPQPEVTSAVVRMVPTATWPEAEYRAFRSLIKALFGQRRKQVGTLLRREFGLTNEALMEVARATGCDPSARPEQLSTDRLRSLANHLAGRNVL
jgi:16S rRNA (adenine1518-N6/adenine1519-N6)-dimethyltransferase